MVQAKAEEITTPPLLQRQLSISNQGTAAIDLGSFHAVMAQRTGNDNQVRIVQNAKHEHVTPVVINWKEEGGRTYGSTALVASSNKKGALNTFFYPTRFLGLNSLDDEEQVNKELKFSNKNDISS